MENINMLIGKRVKTIRKENNETQQELAEAIHLEQSSISNIEAGKTTITIENLFAIAEHYKISVDYILTDISDSTLLDKLKKYVSVKYRIYSYDEYTKHPCPVLVIDDHFFKYIIEEAKIEKMKISDDSKERIIYEKKQDFYSYIEKEENEKGFVEVIPVPEIAVLPDEGKKDWRQWDLIKYVESTYSE